MKIWVIIRAISLIISGVSTRYMELESKPIERNVGPEKSSESCAGNLKFYSREFRVTVSLWCCGVCEELEVVAADMVSLPSLHLLGEVEVVVNDDAPWGAPGEGQIVQTKLALPVLKEAIFVVASATVARRLKEKSAGRWHWSHVCFVGAGRLQCSEVSLVEVDLVAVRTLEYACLVAHTLTAQTKDTHAHTISGRLWQVNATANPK